MFYADNIYQMQRNSIERQVDCQQRQLAKSQAFLQTQILNTEFEDQNDLFAKNSNQRVNNDDDVYKIQNTLVEDVHHARHHWRHANLESNQAGPK